MSLFDDDFYSSKVSRKAKRDLQSGHSRGNKWFSGVRNQKHLQLVILSSVTTVIVMTVLYGLIFGFNPSSKSSNLDLSARAVQASDHIRPAVVSIINEQKFSLGLNGGVLEQDSDEGGIYRETGVGSGVIVQKDKEYAYIVTNYHVVASAHRVKAVLTTGEQREAEVVGLDQITDLAVLKMKAAGIDQVAEIGDSSSLRAAEFVMAMGNPLGMGESITFGVVSVIRETVPVSLGQNGMLDWEQEVIRVDAAINQGNSGGPLVDLNGRVVGINSMKISNFGVESIGYAIPINNVMPIVGELIEQGYVSRAYLGVYMLDLQQYWNRQELDADGSDGEGSLSLPKEVYEGIIVLEALGPAKEAGLQYNDVIVKLDDTKVGSTRELRKYLYNHKRIGDSIVVHYYRGNELREATVTLGENIPEE
ncbi:S1C family serine protease [Paenibacillus camelliae]|uniref:S1C family serine protease n=1 Tax=Paenibacillus camelliae TaxID=512410 RepID=UPI00203F20BC|nr:trypsin-like peptidase domain-containing protein [Paenibacillus camelliae]MCM3635583.1 trypsin-like peptidase domain-containing protein [Paenibacillus camelliae]